MAIAKTMIRMLTATALVFAVTGAVHAAPPPGLPSSFYGGISYVADDNPPVAGHVVQAYVSGVAAPVNSTTITTHLGALVYAIDIVADNQDTPQKDGGLNNDVITFTIGSRIVATAVYSSGTNVALDFILRKRIRAVRMRVMRARPSLSTVWLLTRATTPRLTVGASEMGLRPAAR